MRTRTSPKTSHRLHRRRVSSVLALLTLTAGLGLVASPASAGTRLSIGPSVPETVSAGQVGQPGQLRILNTSFNGPGQSGYTTDSFTVPDPLVPNSITMVLSCGSQTSSANCAVGSRDPGVLVPSATGTGQAGTACANRTFTITLIDMAEGQYAVAPSAPFTLGPADGSGVSNECVIDFTIDVLRSPAIDANPLDPGLQTEQRAFAAAVDIGPNNVDQRATGTGTSETTVLRATPVINTQATSTTIGGAIGDTATISGLVRPVTTGAGTGTVTFLLYSGAPSAGCTEANLVESFVAPITFTGGAPATGGTATAMYTPGSAGTYHWVAVFSGDVNNAPAVGLCGAENETSVVSPPGEQPPPTGTTSTPPYPCVPPPAAGQPTPPLLPGQELCGVAAVLPATSSPAGTARAISPSGCVTRNFNVQVSGRHIRRVEFYLNGKRVKSLTRPNRGTRFALAVRPNTLRRGTHRVLAKTYFTKASKTPTRMLRVTFSRCARQAAAPRFTG